MDDDIYISTPDHEKKWIPNIIQLRGGFMYAFHPKWRLTLESQFNFQLETLNKEQLPDLMNLQLGINYAF